MWRGKVSSLWSGFRPFANGGGCCSAPRSAMGGALSGPNTNALQFLYRLTFCYGLDKEASWRYSIRLRGCGWYCRRSPGGLSGAPLEQRALLCLEKIRPLLNKDIGIIASGGIMSKEAVELRIKAGASIVQIYTGLIYEGPKIVSDSLQNL